MQPCRSNFWFAVQGMLRRVEQVAVKKLLEVQHNHGRTTYKYLRKAQDEACIGMRLNHPNVIQYRGFCIEDGGTGLQALLVMELVLGNEGQETLRCLLDDAVTVSWAPAVRTSVCTGICKGLHYLHAFDIVHRDVKPANVLLTTDTVPKLCDYGLSCNEQSSQDGHTGLYSRSNIEQCQG